MTTPTPTNRPPDLTQSAIELQSAIAWQIEALPIVRKISNWIRVEE